MLLFTGKLHNLSQSLCRQVINAATYVCATRRGIGAVAFCVSADVYLNKMTVRSESDTGGVFASDPVKSGIKTKGLYKCFSIEEACFHCLRFANQPLPLTMPQAVQQLVCCGRQSPRLSHQDVNQCEVRSIHTADE